MSDAVIDIRAAERHGRRRINRARVNEALETLQLPESGTQKATVCVACPYCMTMFEDGLKDAKAGRVQVRDVAEVLAEAVLR